eukprot:TRINITY_DN30863_c0_g2_i2.p1 TRINITY_DN30863_c0_g2~~TRINITY_DN30863_c0_g2_i2.p1  ORF type:complete len:538 (+),score=138.56 TRINITY_DN30863_c0_g2_i2:1257-2870(+)
MMGRNEYFAWAFGTSGADVEDLFLLKQNPANSSEYLVGAHDSYPFEFREEEFRVGDSSVISPYMIKHEHLARHVVQESNEKYRIRVRETLFGPVVSDTSIPNFKTSSLNLEDGEFIAFNWVGKCGDVTDTSLAGFLSFMTASNWSEFESGVDLINGVALNFVYADTNKNMGYRMSGSIPVRSFGDGTIPLQPSHVNDSWKEYIPSKELPRVFNPVSKPFIVVSNNRITPEGYSHFITNDWDSGDEGYRAKRLEQLISSTGGIDSQDAAVFQLDQKSLQVEDFLNLLKILDLSEEFAAQDWRNRISNWNGIPSEGSEEAVVFELWLDELSRMPGLSLSSMFGRSIPSILDYWPYPTFLLDLFMGNESKFCGEFGSATGKYKQSLLTANSSCLDYARDSFLNVVQDIGGSKWRWGDQVHEAQLSHPLFSSESSFHCLSCSRAKHGGDFSTIDSGLYDRSDKVRPQEFGSTFRMIVDLGDLESSMFITTPGQSGNLWAQTYTNWLKMWRKGKYIQMSMITLSSLDAHPNDVQIKYTLNSK